MRVAVYSLTRDRFEYTRRCFASLQAFAGIQFAHFVVDNGSKDGTLPWLIEDYRPHAVMSYEENEGISRASNRALDAIFLQMPSVDVICKVDNDCMLSMENTLGQMAEIVMAAGKFGALHVLSPRVTGIVNQPTRGQYTQLAGRRVGLTAIVGGLFHCVPAAIYREYRYPLDLPLAARQDDHFCNWVKQHGGQVGYVEGLEVEHYEGTDAQAKRYPEYFERKFKEEKEIRP